MTRTTAPPTARRRAPVPATRAGIHSTARMAAGIRSAAHDAGVELTPSYAQRVSVDGLLRGEQVGVTKLGGVVVIHTVPATRAELPVVLGYADADGEWLRDGTRHHAAEGSR